MVDLRSGFLFLPSIAMFPQYCCISRINAPWQLRLDLFSDSAIGKLLFLSAVSALLSCPTNYQKIFFGVSVLVKILSLSLKNK